MLKKTKLTEHASARLIERTSLSPQALCAILDGGAFVFLGKEVGNTKMSKLFFSKSDDQFFVAIQDQKNAEVVTVLTIEYWQNLSVKHFKTNLSVSRNDLLDAIRMVDPSNKILKHPPLVGPKSGKMNFVLVIHALNIIDSTTYFKSVNAGSLETGLLYEKSTEYLSDILKSQFIERMSRKDVLEKHIVMVRWGLEKDLKLNSIDCNGFIDISSVIIAVKKDICLRKNLLEKLDDFLQILNPKRKRF